MQFLAPWMMLGMTAAAVPLVLHLLRRSKPMVVRFAAMEFLRKSVQETSKRIRFRDLILMLMRMGVLMLLAFAMARPTLSLISGSGPVDAAILVDVSRSMATVEGQSSRLEQAVKAAGALLDHLPKGSTARLFAVSDRVADLGIGQAGEFDSLREALANLAPTDRSGDLFPAFASAIDLLRSSPLSQRKVFLFSDMQPAGWQKQGDALRALAKNLPPRHGAAHGANRNAGSFQLASDVDVTGRGYLLCWAEAGLASAHSKPGRPTGHGHRGSPGHCR